MWSGPRNISTAMMRSFSSRPDCFVSDEPFYGAFLKATGAAHPMRDDVIESMETDWRRVAEALAGDPPDGSPIWYQKHMAHHMVGPIAHDDLPGLQHAFLIRDPARVVASYAAKRVAVRSPPLLVAVMTTRSGRFHRSIVAPLALVAFTISCCFRSHASG